MSSPKNLYVVNVSKFITDPEVVAMVTAVNTLLPQFCADWSLRPTRLEVFAPAATSTVKLPAGAAGVVYISDSPDVKGVYGYHDETDKNVAIAKVFTQPVLSSGGKVLAGGAMTVAQVFSHEVLELLADAQCNTWWQTLHGDLVAFEVCDPVQMNVVKVRTEPLGDVWCSDWILPAWADAQASGVPLNHLNTLKTPFSCAKGGYLIRMAAGRSNAVFAAGAPQWLQDAKRAHAQQTRGATAVRGVTTAGLLDLSSSESHCGGASALKQKRRGAAAVRGVTTAGLLELSSAESHCGSATAATTVQQQISKLNGKLAYYQRQNQLDKEEAERIKKAEMQARARLAELQSLQKMLQEQQNEEGRQPEKLPLCGDPSCTGCPIAKSLAEQIKDLIRAVAAMEVTLSTLKLRAETFAQAETNLRDELEKLMQLIGA